MTHPPIPDFIETELARLLTGRPEQFWPGVEQLRERHPERDEEIQRGVEARGVEWRPTHKGTGARAAWDDDVDVKPGDRIGPFAVLDLLGHGGMGSVYLAEQKEPIRRRVALKVIKLGMDTRAVLARFEAERQALALMDHPHIARVLEAGVTPQGRPFFAMDHVRGIPITRYCDNHKLSVDERLALFTQVCSGVQHAHSRGVIHRDLTPNNVLVALQDGKPAVKIIDFGLAKATERQLTERTMFTELGVILGTPEYMSPEQAGVDALDMDARSDVYTLGVLLYELLTGRLPFEPSELRAAGYDAMCKTIREVDPPRPSTRVTTHVGGTNAAAKLRGTDSATLLRRLRGDLEWVVLKCLEKDRARRYDTVRHIVEDLQRHVDGKPLLAGPRGLKYCCAKFARRHRALCLGAGLAFAAALVAGGWLLSPVISGLLAPSTYLVTIKTTPEAVIFVNGRAAGRGPEAVVMFDFAACHRVYLQVACKGYAPSLETFVRESLPDNLIKTVRLAPTKN